MSGHNSMKQERERWGNSVVSVGVHGHTWELQSTYQQREVKENALHIYAHQILFCLFCRCLK